jgi:hypothetical protein
MQETGFEEKTKTCLYCGRCSSDGCQSAQRVAANPTKTTAANAAAETCLSEGALLTVGVADGELEVLEPESEPEPESELELEPEPEPEPESELEPEPEPEPPELVLVLVLEEPVVVAVTKPVFVEEDLELPVPVEEEPEVVAVEISRQELLAIFQKPQSSTSNTYRL